MGGLSNIVHVSVWIPAFAGNADSRSASSSVSTPSSFETIATIDLCCFSVVPAIPQDEGYRGSVFQ